VLWGTNINTNDIQNKLKEFLQTFSITEDDDQIEFNAEPHYISLLKQCAETEEYVLDVDCDHLFQFNKQLY